MSLPTVRPTSLVLENPEVALRRSSRRGLALVAFLVFGLGGLAAFLPMSGAVVAGGTLNVESKVKKIAHPTGGVVAEILVHDGDQVKAGQILVRLDSTVSSSSANLTGESVDQLLARRARLIATRDAAGRITFPAELTSRANDPTVAALMAQETRLFNLVNQTQVSQIAQLRERINQTNEQITGFQAQADAARESSGIIETQRANTKSLLDQHLTTEDRYNALERDAVSLKATAAANDASVAGAKAAITGTQQQILSLQQDSRSQAGTELADVESKLSGMQQSKVQAVDTYERSLIRAPQDGVVDNLAFNTIGGVIPPGETILEIVPDRDDLVVESKVKVTDIDQLHVGQTASLHFSAFDTRTTPQLSGKVTQVSADRETDQRTGAAFYTVDIEIPKDQLPKLGGQKLIAGMPVE
ncbi:MAG: rhizobiocin secretion protein RspE, partial [Caulobacteraceae bacterium]|nr:rhizobiocin secretion protein RspE [Caulobacteraceae bacterium]